RALGEASQLLVERAAGVGEVANRLEARMLLEKLRGACRSLREGGITRPERPRAPHVALAQRVAVRGLRERVHALRRVARLWRRLLLKASDGEHLLALLDEPATRPVDAHSSADVSRSGLLRSLEPVPAVVKRHDPLAREYVDAHRREGLPGDRALRRPLPGRDLVGPIRRR